MERLWYVYILECKDASYYIGVTNDIDRRIAEHNNGINPTCYTFKRRPLKLVHLEEYDSILDAIAREKQLKRWSRAKKKALIEDNEQLLFQLSQNRTGVITTYHVLKSNGSASSP